LFLGPFVSTNAGEHLRGKFKIRQRRQRGRAKDIRKLLPARLPQSQRRTTKIACCQVAGGLTAGKPSRDRTPGGLPLNLRRDIRWELPAK
jgi:hypothetical protein